MSSFQTLQNILDIEYNVCAKLKCLLYSPLPNICRRVYKNLRPPPKRGIFYLFLDLGVQRGVCHWFLSLYTPEIQAVVSPKKKALAKKNKGVGLESSPEMQTPSTPKRGSPSGQQDEPGHLTPLAASSGAAEIPPAFTPSAAKTLNREVSKPLLALPDALTPAILKSRLAGKKIKYVSFLYFLSRRSLSARGAFLTPKEMEELTECWAPYRSLGKSPILHT